MWRFPKPHCVYFIVKWLATDKLLSVNNAFKLIRFRRLKKLNEIIRGRLR